MLVCSIAQVQKKSFVFADKMITVDWQVHLLFTCSSLYCHYLWIYIWELWIDTQLNTQINTQLKLKHLVLYRKVTKGKQAGVPRLPLLCPVFHA